MMNLRQAKGAGILAGKEHSVRSLSLRANLCFRPFRYELRVVATVEEDHAVKFVTPHDGPATTLGRIHFVVAVPGPLDRWLTVSRGEAAVHVVLDVSEVELAA